MNGDILRRRGWYTASILDRPKRDDEHEDGETLKVTGKAIGGVTRERARQLEEMALAKYLRHLVIIQALDFGWTDDGLLSDMAAIVSLHTRLGLKLHEGSMHIDDLCRQVMAFTGRVVAIGKGVSK